MSELFVYDSQNLVARIKARALEQNVLVKKLLGDCGLNINYLSQVTDKKGMSCFCLAKIADYLDCSVDYLLGRTDKPEVNR